jgi:hypothetical protein
MTKETTAATSSWMRKKAYLSMAEVCALQPSPTDLTNEAKVSAWVTEQRLFFVSLSPWGRKGFPSYQFDPHGQPLPVIQQILAIFNAFEPDPELRSCLLEVWFRVPNGWVTDAQGHPLAPKDALSSPDQLLKAARGRYDSYVA